VVSEDLRRIGDELARGGVDIGVELRAFKEEELLDQKGFIRPILVIKLSNRTVDVGERTSEDESS
jgi:hypothetical protein